MPQPENSADPLVQNPVLKYAIGDCVTFTNDQGVIFKGHKVTGFYGEEGNLYQYGYRYYIDTDAPWMPKKEESLSLAT